ncbi:MAG: DUF3786 domain-containing protein [Caldilineales bacterium]|nr:DUF3786 domain-containing protein [Caldilineales bacterium]
MTQIRLIDRNAPKPLEVRAEELRAALRLKPPARLARRTGSQFRPDGAGGEFELEYWGQPVLLSFPDLIACDQYTGRPLDPLAQALLLYYFHDADGTPPAGQWISFSELPDGTFYAQAFQGYTGQELLAVFDDDIDAFRRAAMGCNGQAVGFADAAFAFAALPLVPVLAACWQGDEDFPSSYRILFDASASYHLSTEGCAILGSVLTRRLAHW